MKQEGMKMKYLVKTPIGNKMKTSSKQSRQVFVVAGHSVTSYEIAPIANTPRNGDVEFNNGRVATIVGVAQ